MSVERFTLKSISKEILKELNFERGFLYTFKALTFYPARAIKEYLYEDRSRLVKSFRFLFIATAIATFLTVELDLFETVIGADTTVELSNDTKVDPEVADKIGQKIGGRFYEIFTNYFNLFMFLSIPLFSLFSAFFFRKHGLNYAEHLVVNSFILGYLTYLYIPFAPFYQIAAGAYLVVSILYNIVVYYFIFRDKGRFTIPKSIAAIIFGYVSLLIVVSVFMLLAVMFNF